MRAALRPPQRLQRIHLRRASRRNAAGRDRSVFNGSDAERQSPLTFRRRKQSKNGIEAALESYRAGRVVDAKRAREIIDAALGR